MKETIVLTFLTVVMVSITAFEFRHSAIESKEMMGKRVIAALQQSSAEEFTGLFPTLSDFHQLMLRNSELYGKNLAEAAREFEKEFNYELSPAFNRTFEGIVKEGNRLGVDWRSAKFVSADVPEEVRDDFAVVPLTIRFTSAGKEHQLKIEKAFVINGEWKISQYIALD